MGARNHRRRTRRRHHSADTMALRQSSLNGATSSHHLSVGTAKPITHRLSLVQTRHCDIAMAAWPGPTRWVLRSRSISSILKALTAAFPDAIMVQTHRDPTDASLSPSMTCCGQRRYFGSPQPTLCRRQHVGNHRTHAAQGRRDGPRLKQTIVDITFDHSARTRWLRQAHLRCRRRYPEC